MGSLDEYSQAIERFHESEESYKGAIMVSYSINGFVPWIWCAPLPQMILQGLQKIEPFKISYEGLDFEVTRLEITNSDFAKLLVALKNHSCEFEIGNRKFRISEKHSSPTLNHKDMGTEKQSVESMCLEIVGDNAERDQAIGRFDHQRFSEALFNQRGVRSIEKLLSVYLPFNKEDAPPSFTSISPHVQIYLPTYVKIRTCLQAESSLFVVASNFGNFDLSTIKAQIAFPWGTPLELPPPEIVTNNCEPVEFGELMLNQNSFSFEAETNIVGNPSIILSIVIKDKPVVQAPLNSAITDVSAHILGPCNYFRESHRRHTSSLILMYRFGASYILNSIGWLLLLSVGALSIYIVYKLWFEKASLVTLAPVLSVVATLLLLCVTFSNSLEIKHNNSKPRASELFTAIRKCRDAVKLFGATLAQNSFIERTKFESLVSDIVAFNTTVVTKDFARLYHRFRGFCIVRQMRKWIDAIEKSIAEVTKAKTYIETWDDNLTQSAVNCAATIGLYNSFRLGKYEFGMGPTSECYASFVGLMEYLLEIENWIGTRYSVHWV